MQSLSKIILVVLHMMIAVPSFGLESKLQDEKEDRARALFTELRCVVCQNQSIDSSDADVAKDLRQIVREQISAGKSNAEIREFLVARYGEFILLKPAFAWHTAVLWSAPLLLLIAGFLLVLRVNRRVPSVSNEVLSGEEEAEIERLLKKST